MHLTLSAEALRNALYKFKTYLLTYLLQSTCTTRLAGLISTLTHQRRAEVYRDHVTHVWRNILQWRTRLHNANDHVIFDYAHSDDVISTRYNDVTSEVIDHLHQPDKISLKRIKFYSFTARRVCIARTMPWQDVRPSVCLSVSHTPVFCLHISSQFFFENRAATPFSFFRTKRDGNTSTRIPLTGTSNARGYEKITIFN